MSDVSPYGVTQNANAELTTADALVGERVSRTIGDAVYGTLSPFSTAPYVPPKAKVPPPTDNRCIAVTAQGTLCRTFKVTGSDYCVFHKGRT